MAIKELLGRIPLLQQILEPQQLRVREETLSKDLYRRWILEPEIDYDEMMLELREQVETDGVNEERVFIGISKLYNPSRSV